MSKGLELLGKLFGGASKVKVLRFFVLNPETQASLAEIALVVKVGRAALRRELSALSAMKFVTERQTYRPNKSGTRKLRVRGWQLDPTFPFVSDLRRILNYDIVEDREDVARKFRGCGRLKLIVLAGLFLSDPDGRIDLAIVGDDLNRRALEKAIHKMEADFGKEFKYAILDTEDFNFRLFSGDKFVRDILDYPHEYALNKLGI